MNGVLAHGAEELMIALATPSLRGVTGVPALLWGKPGTGKTTYVESLRDQFPVVTLIASLHDPTDFGGLPVHTNDRVRFLPPEWATHFDETQDGVLFLDELTTTPPAVQSALLRMVLERRVGNKALPSAVRIAAAANEPDEIVGGFELTPPLANRFVHIQWDLPGTAYAQALQEGFGSAQLPVLDADAHREAVSHWQAMTATFLSRSPGHVHTRVGDGEYAQASPRTWSYAIALMASCDVLGIAPSPGSRSMHKVFANLLTGCIGSGAATALIAFLKNLKLPDPDKVLAGKVQVDVDALQDDELFVFFSSIGARLTNADRWKKGSLVDATTRVLELYGAVSARGRVDTVFAPLRQIVRGQVLQRALVQANEQGKQEILQGLIRDHLKGELAEYVGLVTGPAAHRGNF